MVIPNNGILKHLGQGAKMKRCLRTKSEQVVEQVDQCDSETQIRTPVLDQSASRNGEQDSKFRTNIQAELGCEPVTQAHDSMPHCYDYF